mgnify:CR=1 FL=1
MSLKQKVLETIMSQISDVNKKIRDIEDASRKFSVDCSGDRVYNSLVGYRQALQDLLDKTRSINEKSPSNRNL